MSSATAGARISVCVAMWLYEDDADDRSVNASQAVSITAARSELYRRLPSEQRYVRASDGIHQIIEMQKALPVHRSAGLARLCSERW